MSSVTALTSKNKSTSLSNPKVSDVSLVITQGEKAVKVEKFTGSLKAVTAAVKASGEVASRPDGLAISLGSVYFTPEENIRPIDAVHVQEILHAIMQGDEIDPLEVEAVVVDGIAKFQIVDGHHSFCAYLEAVKQGKKIDKVPAILFKGNAMDKLVRMYNSTRGKALTVMQNARVFQRMINEGMKNHEVSERLGVKRSVISNSLVLLRGDSNLQAMIDNGDISATRAMNFIREYGDEATAMAKAEFKIANTPSQDINTVNISDSVKSDSTQSIPDTNSASDSNQDLEVTKDNATEQPNQNVAVQKKARKQNNKQVLKMKKLSVGKTQTALNNIKVIARRINEAKEEHPEVAEPAIQLPSAILESIIKLAQEMEAISEENAETRKKLAELAAQPE